MIILDFPYSRLSSTSTRRTCACKIDPCFILSLVSFLLSFSKSRAVVSLNSFLSFSVCRTSCDENAKGGDDTVNHKNTLATHPPNGTVDHSIFSKTNFALGCLPWCVVGGMSRGSLGISRARVLNHVEHIWACKGRVWVNAMTRHRCQTRWFLNILVTCCLLRKNGYASCKIYLFIIVRFLTIVRTSPTSNRSIPLSINFSISLRKCIINVLSTLING